MIIEPGVEVRFKTGTDFNYDGGVDCGFMRVNGKLLARGTASQMITFTRDGNAGNWGVIYFEEANDSSIISFANVQYANKIDNLIPYHIYNDCLGAITLYQTNGSIVNSIVSENIMHGVQCKTESPFVDNSSPNVIGNLIFNNAVGISIWNSSPVIVNNTIASNSEYGIYTHMRNLNIWFYNNIIYDNDQFYYIYTGGHTQNLQFMNNSLQGSSINLPSQIILLGDNVFNTNPLFVDLDNFNFQLNHNSHCINTGTPDTTGLGLPDLDLEGNSRITYNQIDIGAYEFNGSDFLYITAPSPNGYWKNNNTHSIGWSSSTASNLKIEYSIDKGLNWSTITSSTPNDGSFDWLVPGVESDSAMIKITDLVNPSIMDTVSFRIGTTTHITDLELIYGTWTLAESPYIIEGEAILPADSTLIIEPGVEVRFKTGTDFNYDGGVDCGFMRVNGKLLAQGTASQMITFTRDGNAGNWGVIYFEEANDSSIISFANVQFANKLENIFPSGYYNDCFGAITFYKNSASVENSIICNNLNDGVHIDDYDVDYQNKIKGNLLHNNKNGISVWFASPLITNNTIVYNTEYAFYSRFWAAPFIRNTITWDNADFIYISTGGHTQVNTFEYCLIQVNESSLPTQVVNSEGNVFMINPLFENPTNDDFSINYTSPCRNAGTPDTTGLNLPMYDLAR
ncbi:MAG: right-handed parallel beta-helix repeat-containing protein [Bacteroidales bacterium]